MTYIIFLLFTDEDFAKARAELFSVLSVPARILFFFAWGAGMCFVTEAT